MKSKFQVVLLAEDVDRNSETPVAPTSCAIVVLLAEDVDRNHPFYKFPLS